MWSYVSLIVLPFTSHTSWVSLPSIAMVLRPKVPFSKWFFSQNRTKIVLYAISLVIRWNLNLNIYALFLCLKNKEKWEMCAKLWVSVLHELEFRIDKFGRPAMWMVRNAVPYAHKFVYDFFPKIAFSILYSRIAFKLSIVFYWQSLFFLLHNILRSVSFRFRLGWVAVCILHFCVALIELKKSMLWFVLVMNNQQHTNEK